MEIAIISGKGGTGKSCVSAALATLSNKVVLADCDVDAANMYLIFHPLISEEKIYIGSRKAIIDYNKCSSCGLCMDYCRFDAISKISGEIVISELLCDGCELCSRICHEEAILMANNQNSRLYAGDFRNGKMVYGRLAPGEETSGKLINLVREKAKQAALSNGIETIIIDGPPGIGCPVISTISGIDHIIIVTEPSKSALDDLKRALQVVSVTGIASSVIINKYDLNIKMSRQIEEYCQNHDVQIVAHLPYDNRVVDAMVSCMSMTEYAPETDFSKSIQMVFNRILYGNKKRIYPTICW